MNKYLKELATEILKNCQDGLTKVKFAKIIYFVHKGLVCQNLSNTNDLKFIRMPLGPVPIGFMELSKDADFKVTHQTNIGPVYNSEVYKLSNSSLIFCEDKFTNVIKKLSHQLNRLTTSNLVDKSHSEPSWINNINGTEYFIGDDDLNLSLPVYSKTMTNKEDSQKLQEKLVEGMLDDIVSGSTSLEYPQSNN